MELDVVPPAFHPPLLDSLAASVFFLTTVFTCQSSSPRDAKPLVVDEAMFLV